MAVDPIRTLLDGVVATGEGAWIGIQDLDDPTVHIEGISGDTVQINVTNSPTKPTTPGSGITLKETTADGIWSIGGNVAWIQGNVSVHSGGTINMWVAGKKGRG